MFNRHRHHQIRVNAKKKGVVTTKTEYTINICEMIIYNYVYVCVCES
jgi:hypothetical protein